MNERPKDSAKIAPNRKWFGNVRTIDQKALEKFRIETALNSNQSHEFLIKSSKLPQSLLVDSTIENKVNLLQVEKFEVQAYSQDTFGKKQKRKRPKLNVETYEQMASEANCSINKYKLENDSDHFRLIVLNYFLVD